MNRLRYSKHYSRLPQLRMLLVVLAALVCVQPAHASASFRLVKHINTVTTLSSYLMDSTAATIGNTFYFVATDGAHGKELWKSDGTEAGTTMVKDIYPAAGNGVIADYDVPPTAVGSTLFFAADDGVHGAELWKSDGTEAGTVRVKDIRPGGQSGIPVDYRVWFTAIGSSLFFLADDGVHGAELWKSDGTEAGTTMVKDITSSTVCCGLEWLTAVGSTLFFVADDGVHGYELWKSDGTEAGTTMVKDIIPPPCGRCTASSPSGLTAMGSTLFFVADGGVNGQGLWKSDGTEAGTLFVGSFLATNLTAVGNRLFFVTNGANSDKLWKSDGTEAGTTLVKNIGSPDRYEPRFFTAVGNRLFFMTDDSVHGLELWTSDGSEAGTVLVKDIMPGPGGYNSSGLLAVGATLYFGADDGVHGYELWKSDGTEAGTTLVKDTNPSAYFEKYPGPYTLVAAGNLLFFAGDDGVHGYEPWKSDGTEAGTTMLKDVNPTTAVGSSPSNLTVVGSKLFFTADDGVHGPELWTSNGTAAGTVLVKDITPGTVDYVGPSDLRAVGTSLFFTADDGVHGVELWKSDGTEASTAMVKDIYPEGCDDSYFTLRCTFTGFTALGSHLFFLADDGVHGAELWTSDGTEAGTAMVKDINPAAATGSFPFYLTAVGSTLFFVADDGVHGAELWKSDGTEAGTVLVKDTDPDGRKPYDNPSGLTAAGSRLFFLADDGVHGYELWTSDGTESGTSLVKDINLAAAGGCSCYYLTAVGSSLFFSARDGVHGYELWTSDGTEAGTRLVKDINAYGSSSPAGLTAMGNTLFFSATGGLWKSDGTEAGTTLVNRHGAADLTAVGNTLFFAADDGVHGRELWRSDGTPSGTTMVQDLSPGEASSAPSQFTRIGTTVFFSAATPTTGRELWAMNYYQLYMPLTRR